MARDQEVIKDRHLRLPALNFSSTWTTSTPVAHWSKLVKNRATQMSVAYVTVTLKMKFIGRAQIQAKTETVHTDPSHGRLGL